MQTVQKHLKSTLINAWKIFTMILGKPCENIKMFRKSDPELLKFSCQRSILWSVFSCIVMLFCKQMSKCVMSGWTFVPLTIAQHKLECRGVYLIYFLLHKISREFYDKVKDDFLVISRRSFVAMAPCQR